MDDRKDDVVPEWQTKSDQASPEPVGQPGFEYRAFSDPAAQPGQPFPYDQPPMKKASGLGIASLIIGIIGVIGLIAMVVVIGTAIADVMYLDSYPLTIEDLEDNPQLVQAAGAIFGVLGMLFLMFIGFILGIIGLFQKSRKKGFPIAGTIINGLFVVGFLFLMVLGFLSQLSAM